jgi:hypothetical protein
VIKAYCDRLLNGLMTDPLIELLRRTIAALHAAHDEGVRLMEKVCDLDSCTEQRFTQRWSFAGSMHGTAEWMAGGGADQS